MILNDAAAKAIFTFLKSLSCQSKLSVMNMIQRACLIELKFVNFSFVKHIHYSCSWPKKWLEVVVKQTFRPVTNFGH